MGAVDEKMRNQAVLAILIGFYVSTLHGIPRLPSCGRMCGFDNSGVCLFNHLQLQPYDFPWQRIPGDCFDGCSCFKKKTGGGGGGGGSGSDYEIFANPGMEK